MGRSVAAMATAVLYAVCVVVSIGLRGTQQKRARPKFNSSS